jgi:DNA processing protein
MLHGIGPRKARKLIRKIGSVDKLFTEPPLKLAHLSGVDVSFFKKMRRMNALEKAVHAVQFHETKKIQTLFYLDSNYPRRLTHCSDAPTALFMKGNLSMNTSKLVSIVGTRKATSYGKELCRRLIESFVGKDIVVVSGLAFGIDSFIHQYCVDYNVPTVAVLGHGLDRIYPSQNKGLASKILEYGALIPEFVPGTSPDRENFPKRNRIVAGLSDATIVVESTISGGSLITAHQAFGYDRDVFAFPGNVNTETSQGCNAIISQEKARCIQSPLEFLDWMEWNTDTVPVEVQRSCFPSLNDIQKEIVTAISNEESLHIDVLSARLSWPISKLNTELFHLILSGVVIELPGKRYKTI